MDEQKIIAGLHDHLTMFTRTIADRSVGLEGFEISVEG